MDKPFTHLLNTLDGVDLMPLPEKDRVKIEEAIRTTEWLRPWLYDASPALLEACKDMLKAADELMTEYVSKQRAANWGVINQAMVDASAAIRAARGGQA